MYKLANLDKNKRNHLLASYSQGIKDGIGWLWSANYAYPHLSTFQNGDVFVCLGKKESAYETIDAVYGIDTWYEALGPDGKIHKFTPAMRTSYFRNL